MTISAFQPYSLVSWAKHPWRSGKERKILSVLECVGCVCVCVCVCVVGGQWWVANGGWLSKSSGCQLVLAEGNRRKRLSYCGVSACLLEKRPLELGFLK